LNGSELIVLLFHLLDVLDSVIELVDPNSDSLVNLVEHLHLHAIEGRVGQSD